jgi:hypothetical protein
MILIYTALNKEATQCFSCTRCRPMLHLVAPCMEEEQTVEYTSPSFNLLIVILTLYSIPHCPPTHSKCRFLTAS